MEQILVPEFKLKEMEYTLEEYRKKIEYLNLLQKEYQPH